MSPSHPSPCPYTYRLDRLPSLEGTPAPTISLPASDTSFPDLEKVHSHSQAPSATVNESPRPAQGLKWFLILLSLYTISFLYGLDNTIVADIQGAVVETFDDVSKLSWLGSGFPLGGVATILTFGKAYGIFNNKYLYLSSIMIFEIGSALCGAAPTMDALIVGRVIAGLGAAGMFLGVLNMLSRFTTERERPIYMGMIAVVWGVGTILGPVIGGIFADSSATWRWAFYINIIVAPIAPIMIIYLPSVQPFPSISIRQKLSELDYLGAVLNVEIYVAWVLVLQFGGSTWAWSDGRTIACFVIAGVGAAAFLTTQNYSVFTTPEQRLFPIEFLKRRTMMLLFLVSCCIHASLFIVIFYIPVFFEFVNGDSGIESAVRLLPFVLTLVVCNLINGYTMPIVSYYMPWYVFSGALITTGGAMMMTVTATTSASFVYGATSLLGIGTGTTINAAYSVATAKVPLASIPAAISFINLAQIGAIMHALAISGAIYQNLSFRFLKVVFSENGLHFSDLEIRAAVAGSKSAIFVALDEDTRRLAVNAIVESLQRVYGMVVASGAVCLIASLAMRREKLFMEMTAGG